MNAVLRNRSLVIMGISESVSTTGSWVTMMAVFGLIIFRGQGNVSQSGLIYLAGLVPTLLFSPVAGWLCDRFDRRLLMIGSELLSGLAVSGIIFTQSIELLYILLALQAVSTSIMSPARQSSIVLVVDRPHLTQANAFLQQLSSIVKIFGPILAGLILTVLAPRQAVILDVVSFALSAIILGFLPALPPARQEKQVPNAAHKPGDGIFTPLVGMLRNSSQLRLLYVVAFLVMSSIVAVDILAAILTRDVLKGGEEIFGLQIGLIGFGTLLGAASLMVRPTRINPWVDILGGLTLAAAIPAALAAACFIADPNTGRAMVFSACLLGGFGIGRKMVRAGTLLQTLPPAHLLGRAGGLFQSVVVSAQLIGTLLIPVVVPAVLPVYTYLGIVSGMILVAVLVGILTLGKTLWVVPPAVIPAQE
jgi:MFS family permease